MSNFGTAPYKNRGFAARRAKNCTSRLQNNQFWNRLRYVMINYLDTGIWIEDKKEWEGIADLLKAKYKESGYEIKGPYLTM
jgi:hypothetical protein